MASNEVTATLRFLTDAGHLLATTAPESSAYLMSRRSDLMFEHELTLSDKHREHVCNCCGHIMLLGQRSNLQVNPEKRARPGKKGLPIWSKGKETQKTALQPRQSGPTKAITCGHCGRRTEIKLPTPTPISRRKVKLADPRKASTMAVSTPSLSNTPGSSTETPSQKSSANASSKKRAKSRKAGLQALLSQSSTPKTGLGLSLADFMER